MSVTTSDDARRASGRARGGPGQGTPMRVAPARRRVSLPWVALGVVLVAGGMLAASLALANVGQRRAVLVIARPVPVGQILAEQDLTAVRVAADPGLAALPASARQSVVGRPAAVPLVPGSLLTEAALGQPATLAPEEALVGVLIKPGQAPPGLQEGATVQVLQVGASAQPGGPGDLDARTLVGRAVVASVTSPDPGSGGGLVVGLRLPKERVEVVAGAAAAGRVALAWVQEAGP